MSCHLHFATFKERSSVVQELKKTQIQNSELRQQVCEFQDQIMELQVQVSGKPKELENNEKVVMAFGHQFCIMNKPFFPKMKMLF